MSLLPNGPARLITAAALAPLLGRADLAIVDCRFNLLAPAAGRQAWVAGHIPGAHYAHLDDDLAGPRGPGTGRHPLPDPRRFAACAGGWGIAPGVGVVAYDDAGGQIAARLWWLLRWMGHDEVALLDGGYPAWVAAGLPTSQDPPEPRSRTFVGSPGHQPVVTTPELAAALGSAQWLLLDARAGARFRGEQEPIDPVAGHVPGARSAPAAETLTAAGHLLGPEQLRERYATLLAGRAPARVAAMCGSGITGCHILFTMARAGLSGASLYAGSWSEWIQSPARPVARGEA